jgi:NADH-quinone oxidoreductase subunit J
MGLGKYDFDCVYGLPGAQLRFLNRKGNSVTADAILFWILALVTLASALTVILVPNPIYSALSLVMTMVGISALFVTLGAYFIAGVQLIVYAGAVMVLFVMVLMLFDLKHELQAFTQGKLSGAVKIGAVGMLAGLVVGAILMSSGDGGAALVAPAVEGDQTKALGKILFSQYLFGFEVLGVLLLVIAVGVVALSRSKGGTHAKR